MLLERTRQNASKIIALTASKRGEEFDPGEGTNTFGETRNFLSIERFLQSLKPIDDKDLFILSRRFPLLDVSPFKCNEMYSSLQDILYTLLPCTTPVLETVRYEDHHPCYSSTTLDRLWYDGAQSSVSHDPSW